VSSCSPGIAWSCSAAYCRTTSCMLKRPEASRRNSDLSTRDNKEKTEAPATCSAASSSQPPWKTESLRKTCCSASGSKFHEWLNTARRLPCCADASREADLRKSRLSLIDLAILAVGKWRTHAAANTIPNGKPSTSLQMSSTPCALSGERSNSHC